MFSFIIYVNQKQQFCSVEKKKSKHRIQYIIGKCIAESNAVIKVWLGFDFDFSNSVIYGFVW